MHIGSFRSMVIHDVLQRVLKDDKKAVTYLYGYDDYDPMDAVPIGLKGYDEHLGKPLVNVPANSSGFKSFADEFIAENKRYHEILGVVSESYRTSELYQSGKFNTAIKKVLDNAATIRRIYKEVSGSDRPDDWNPLQVICPNCGKLGSTYVSSWDGKEVSFTCGKDLVPWAKGCGYEGKISPYDGRGKMHWRVEWAAKWNHFGVTIEAAGKDHANKGGSFDTGARILKEVFGKGPIAAFPHEFFLLDGKKMGSTKGLVTPSDALEVFAPEVLRFLVVRSRPNQAIEINLSEIVPRIYDEYDRCQVAYLDKTDQDLSDYFYYSQVNPSKLDKVRKARFMDVVNLLQLPSMQKELTSPEVAPRAPYAKAWLEKYGPEEIKFLVQEKLSPAAKNLTPRQKEFLSKATAVTGSPEEIQTKLYQLSKEMGLSAGEAFGSIYQAFLGKTSGPRAGELLASLSPEFVKKRLEEVAK
jgi:lysyl-tRNA synthetase class 1